MATTTNYSWTTPDDTDLVKDGASAIRTLGSAIDTTVFNNAAAAVAKSTIDAKGDLLVGTADDTVGRLAVGTDGYTLVADSSTSTGLKWAAAAGGGKVLQVVSATTTTSTTVASTSYTDTTLTATITPTLASSTILVMVSQRSLQTRSSTSSNALMKLLRGATTLFEGPSTNIGAGGATDLTLGAYTVFIYRDSPATTSATTYKTQGSVSNTANSGQIVYQSDTTTSMITLLEIGA